MGQKNINEFVKGVNSDYDVLRLDNQTSRDIQNMRMLDVNGKGLVLTNIGGNEERFSLTDGFIPIGSVEYNGIIYIASFSQPTGLGEIGCYPAPEPLVNEDCSLSGFDAANKKYAPLFNFTGINDPKLPGITSLPFVTELFNFGDDDEIPQVNMIAREDFDGSVNLYICGERNPIRVFNTGFNQEGECTSEKRRYWNRSFPNEVNLLNETERPMDIEFKGTGDAGRLRGGGWIFFFRYANENYDTTSFSMESNNVIIMPGVWTTEGVRRKGVAGTVETTKSVRFRLTNIDPAYSYIEIGFQFDNNGTKEYGILTERITVDPNQPQLDIEITGHEDYYEVDVSEIIQPKPEWDSAMSHEQLENRYFAADLFSSTNVTDERIRELFDVCQLITPEYDDNLALEHIDSSVSFNDNANENYYKGIYNREENAYSNVGYFRGESYPFGVVFLLNSGRELGAFPILGSDMWNPGAPTSNNEGIVRFPSVQYSQTVAGNDIKVMGIKFNINAAMAALPAWASEEISGFYFVRGNDRQRNLLYQGQACDVYNAMRNPGLADFTWFLWTDKPTTYFRTENWAPTFDGGYENWIIRNDQSLFNDIYTFVDNNPYRSVISGNRSAFFSIDHFLLKSLPVSRPFIQSWGRVNHNQWNGSTGNTGDNQYNYYMLRDFSYSYSPTTYGYIDASNVAPWEPTNNNLFVSYHKEGTSTEYQCFTYFYAKNGTGTFFFEMANQETAFNSFIGLSTRIIADKNLVNIYLTDPDPSVYDISKLYDIKAVNYAKISGFYSLIDAVANPGWITQTPHYKGDCFLQRTFLKTKFNPKYDPSLESDGINDGGAGIPSGGPFNYLFNKTYSFGQVLLTITENSMNAECRLDDVINKFAPGSTSTIYEFAVKNIDKESDLLNRGYNQQLSSKTWKGINLEIPFFPERRPTGIMYSNKYNVGAFKDGYREIDIAALKEYDYRLGRIVQVVNHNGTLVSIQEFGINKHLVNERALLQGGDSSGELLLGVGNILDTKALNLSDAMGSQHQWSIVKTDMSIYGLDFNKRKIWRINPQFQVEPISDQKFYRSETLRICEFGSTDSDITEGLPDNPVYKGGVVGYYDKKFHDVYFTIIKKEEDSSDEQVVFNEMLATFGGKRTFKSPFGFTINEDFFTFNPNIFPSTNPDPISYLGDCWIHGVLEIAGNENSTCFYGEAEADISYVEFVVNNPADMTKVFDKLDISSASNDLYRVTFETQHQLTDHFPFVEGTPLSFWRDPEYLENFWRLPITRAQATQDPVNNIYEVGSRLRGRWLKIRLEYKTKSSIFIKSVLTDFRKSNY